MRIKELGYALYDVEKKRLLRNTAGVLFVNSAEKDAEKAREILVKQTSAKLEVRKIKIFFEDAIAVRPE